MNRDRILAILHIIDVALTMEPDHNDTVVELVVSYGSSLQVTPAEVNKVWDMTVGEIFGTPTKAMLREDSDPGYAIVPRHIPTYEEYQR